MVKYLIMDVDGTLTDGKIYMGPAGEAMKAFSVKDGYVINYILKPNNIRPIIITARTSQIVQNRCDELGIKEVYQGKLDKLTALEELIGKNKLGNCAYFGDDILDLKCMLPIKKKGGIVGCPSDAVREVKAISNHVCLSKAGEGALREFAEWLVESKVDDQELTNRVNESIAFLKRLSVSESDVGKKTVVNDKFFYTVQSYQTRIECECKTESHRKYVDIQLMIDGYEVMDVCDISRLNIVEEYDEEKDVMFWNPISRMTRTTLKAGDCIVLYPEHAHRGAMTESNDCHNVLKIVGKVRVD